MKTQLKHRVFFWISFILLFIQAQNEAFASHAQSADITYQCLGGNQYRINLSFYRDCAGVAAPNTVSIDINSASCGQNLTLTLNKIPGTGIEVSPICSSLTTVCSGGSYPGVQEYKYTGIITLPMACSDWTFSFSLCCRNASIGTIVSPSSENIYVEAHLDNLNFPCNNSPTFSNPPIPFVCVGQPYCFNNGSFDADGDSLSYTLIAPETSPTTTVTYISPYSASQPLASSPAVTFNTSTGDMCMTPTSLQVTVFAVLVKEWRGGEFVGSVMRDIQLRTITCTNDNPYVNGINNSGTYTLTACAGVPVNFDIETFDVDAGQNVTLSWNAGIAGASFNPGTGSRPTGHFTWTPSTADIGSGSHCFTVTVQDDNCPFNGSQTYSFCITVTGITLTTSVNATSCGLANGSAMVQVVTGSGPFTYQWLPSGGSSTSATGLTSGTYSVNVTGAGGCVSTAIVNVPSGSAPASVSLAITSVACYGTSTGAVTSSVSGGATPYYYNWSNGATTPNVTGLPAGVYTVTVTTASGCTSTGSATIVQPTSPLTVTMSQQNITCNGFANGSASALPAGGTGAYAFSWNTTPVLTTPTVTNLSPAVYTVTVSDANGCSATGNVSITEPSAITVNPMIVSPVTCNGLSNASLTVGASGGSGPYDYTWNTTPVQSSQTIAGVGAGTYSVTVMDTNGCAITAGLSVPEPPVLAVTSAAYPVSCFGACNGQTVVIPSGGTPTYSYQWLPDGGTSASATSLCPGTYTVTVTDHNGCEVQSALTVTQPAPLAITTMGDGTICAGQNTMISAGATGGTGTYTYSWTGIGTGATQTVAPIINTVYSVVATDANGCSSPTANVIINVTSLTAANLTTSGSAAICYGAQTTVSATVSGSTGPVNIVWSGGLGTGSGPFTVSPSATTNYVVTVSDNCGSVISQSIPVTVNPLPVIDVQPQTVSSCNQVNLSFADNSTTNAGASYVWDFGDGTVSNLVSPAHEYTLSGIYPVQVTVTSPYGCVNSANTTASVTVFQGSVASFTSEGLDGTEISPVYRFSNNSSNSVSYTWNFGDGTGSTVVNPQHTYAQKGIYTVNLLTVSADGCRDSLSADVEVTPTFTIYIPNAFTPNGNGVNDYFTAKGAEITEFKMMIFDRWGELIFETSDLGTGWDGHAKNGSGIAENGVYVYKIEVRDYAQRYHDYVGHVTLLSSE